MANLSFPGHQLSQQHCLWVILSYEDCPSQFTFTRVFQAINFHNSIAYEMEDRGRLNNNVLIFDPGHWFLVTCLQVHLKTKSSKWSPSISGDDLNDLNWYQEMMISVYCDSKHVTLVCNSTSVIRFNTMRTIRRWWPTTAQLFTRPMALSWSLVYSTHWQVMFICSDQTHRKRLEMEIVFHIFPQSVVFHPWEIALIRSTGCDRPSCRHQFLFLQSCSV